MSHVDQHDNSTIWGMGRRLLGLLEQMEHLQGRKQDMALNRIMSIGQAIWAFRASGSEADQLSLIAELLGDIHEDKDSDKAVKECRLGVLFDLTQRLQNEMPRHSSIKLHGNDAKIWLFGEWLLELLGEIPVEEGKKLGTSVSLSWFDRNRTPNRQLASETLQI